MESLHKWLEENMFYCKSNLFEAIYHNPGELKAVHDTLKLLIIELTLDYLQDPNIGKTSYVGSNEGANSNNILVSNKEMQ